MQLLLAFIGGLLFRYIFEIIELGMNHLSNKQTLSTSYIQKEIDNLNPQDEIKEPCIGFHYEEPVQYEED